MPYTLMVDTTGIIKKKHTGYNLGDEIKIEREIRLILGLESLTVDKEVARLMAVVVFPTPPFWFATEIILSIFCFNIFYFKHTTIDRA